ncbi:MAG TPA: ABC transporter permease [Bryobacteraceae bacterium]|nr:ABC transporter permease [Bryobacteraceae bacterium]
MRSEPCAGYLHGRSCNRDHRAKPGSNGRFGRPGIENAYLVSPNYFEVLGVSAIAGRSFDPNGDIADAPHAEAVLSHDLAQRIFGSETAAIGRTVNLNSIHTVLGVTPANFGGTLALSPNQPLWIPLSMHSQVFTGPIERLYNERRFRFLNIFGRLKPGADQRPADASLDTIAMRLEAVYPNHNRGRRFETATLPEAALGFIGPGIRPQARVWRSAWPSASSC